MPTLQFVAQFTLGVHLISIFKLLICIEIVFLSLARSTASASTNSRTCYYPDKSISKGTPCDPNAAVSPCCGPGFICLSNGLCSPGPEDRKSYQYDLYRSACTDPTWNSTACPRLCFGGELQTHCYIMLLPALMIANLANNRWRHPRWRARNRQLQSQRILLLYPAHRLLFAIAERLPASDWVSRDHNSVHDEFSNQDIWRAHRNPCSDRLIHSSRQAFAPP